MLGSGLPSGINLFASLILCFKSLLEIFEHQAHDPPTILVRDAFPIMNTTMTKSWLADPIVLLATLWVGELIGKLVLLGTKVTIFLFVVAKMALAKRTLLFFVQSLARAVSIGSDSTAGVTWIRSFLSRWSDCR